MEDKHIEKGKLILTKTVEGNISKENAKKITFKVMNQETKKTDKYTLDDFSYDEINAKLEVARVEKEHAELFNSLTLWYRTFVMGKVTE